MVPGATIGSDGAVDWIGPDRWNSLAAVNQLGDLPRRQRDVQTRREHRRSRCCRVGGQACQSDADGDAGGQRRLRFMSGLRCAVIDPRLTFSRHRERPRFATRLVPDERMHQLWIDGERTYSDERYEVHERSLHPPRNCAGLAADLLAQGRNG
jgi:hypothetical protein